MSITACLVPVRDKPHRNINTRSVCLSPKIDARQHICILTERCDDLRITNKPETRRADQLFLRCHVHVATFHYAQAEIINRSVLAPTYTTPVCSPSILQSSWEDGGQISETVGKTMSPCELISCVDTAWLRMDRPNNLMQIVGVLMFDGQLDEASCVPVSSTPYGYSPDFTKRPAWRG